MLVQHCSPLLVKIKPCMEMTASRLPPHPHLSSYSYGGHSPVGCWENEYIFMPLKVQSLQA